MDRIWFIWFGVKVGVGGWRLAWSPLFQLRLIPDFAGIRLRILLPAGEKV
jgi:hypothetical protein